MGHYYDELDFELDQKDSEYWEKLKNLQQEILDKMESRSIHEGLLIPTYRHSMIHHLAQDAKDYYCLRWLIFTVNDDIIDENKVYVVVRHRSKSLLNILHEAAQEKKNNDRGIDSDLRVASVAIKKARTKHKQTHKRTNNHE